MIYPKNDMIESLFASAVDPETGEMLLTEEEIEEKLAAIDIEFDDKIKALRNSYMADMVDAECVKAEAQALWKIQQETSKRAKAIENRAERTKRFIAWLLHGEDFNKDGVKISFRRHQVTVIDEGFIEWATHNAPGLLNEPTVKKEELTKALKAGGHIECARLEEQKRIMVK